MSVLLFDEREKVEYPESSRVDNQKNQPTNDVESKNETHVVLVEGEHSHRYSNPTLLSNPKIGNNF